ncbi:MAG: queuine tRNA-ribosyltransferase family protein [Endomicrobium sp.]|jgi:tRNA-guanine family transglycosylase|nr:queuine tRNA-ribosyltransferase family protein [Endomicrobium sp.]
MQGYSKAYLSHLVRSNRVCNLSILSLHNIYVYDKIDKKGNKVIERELFYIQEIKC